MSGYRSKRVCVLETNKYFYDMSGWGTFLWNGQDIQADVETMLPIALEWLVHEQQDMDNNPISIESVYDRNIVIWSMYDVKAKY